jgi:hypothetical protein
MPQLALSIHRMKKNAMSPLQKLPRFVVGAIAGGVLLTNGCALPHADLRYSKALPNLYCPGDAIDTDFTLGTCTSHSGITCESRTPTVALTTTSAALPSRNFTSFTGNASFVPTESSVTLNYSVSPDKPMFPSVNGMGEGRIVGRQFLPESHTLNRIDGEATLTIKSGGVCNGRIPSHAPTMIPAAPFVSARARAQRVCNASMVRVMVDIAGPPGVGNVSASLAPNECVALPPGSEGGMVNVSGPISPDAQCLSTHTSQIPGALDLRVAYTCVD